MNEFITRERPGKGIRRLCWALGAPYNDGDDDYSCFSTKLHMKFYTLIFKLGHKWYFNLCLTAIEVNKV